MSVTLLNSQPIPFQSERLLRAARKALRAESAATAEVSILLTDDETIHDLNLQYRGFDKPTDVLSFSQVERREARGESQTADDRRPTTDGGPIQNPKSKVQNPLVLGDVVISVETAARQADTHGVSLGQELELLVTHGILHLLGYDDMTDEGAEEMQARERALGVRS